MLWLYHKDYSISAYFYEFYKHAMHWGYTDTVEFNGAPYDFRKAPKGFVLDEQDDLMMTIRMLVEQSCHNNYGRKVVLIAHSLGCPTLLNFLNRQCQRWKEKYIKAFISVFGPYGGAVKAVKALASGYDFEHKLVRGHKMIEIARTFPSIMWLLPSSKLWKPDKVIAQTLDRNYTAHNYKKFFEDINTPDGYDMYLDTKDIISDWTAPGVETHCLYGTGVDTPMVLVYGKKNFEKNPTEIMGDGDGTVNLRSAVVCLSFRDKQTQPVIEKAFKNIGHFHIIENNEFFE